MKKQVMPTILIISTILFLCFGFCLPWLVSLSFDRHLETEIKQMGNSEVSLSLKDEAEDINVFSRLSLFNKLMGNSTTVNLPDGDRMSMADAQTEATRCLQQFGYEDVKIKAKPILFTSEDQPEASGIFWLCAWDDNDSAVWLDDQSGKVVGFIFQVNPARESLDVEHLTSSKILPEILDFCQEYYPVDSMEISEDNEEQYTLYLSWMREGEKVACPVTIYIQEGVFCFFNYLQTSSSKIIVK